MRIAARALAGVVGAPTALILALYAGFRFVHAVYATPPIPKDSRTYRGLNTPINPVIPKDSVADDGKQKGAPIVYAIVGGSGFLGSYLIRGLLQTRNVKKIYVLSRKPGQNEWLYQGRDEVEFIPMDVTIREEVVRAIQQTGAEVVFMLAAFMRFQDSLPHQYAPAHNVNVLGTENVLIACEATPSVKYFVHSASVTACQGWDIFKTKYWDLNEQELQLTNMPYSHYGKTKALGEKLVRGFDGRGFRTISLRNCGIFGYGDGVMFDHVIKSPLPAGHDIQQWDYVENVVAAYIRALDVLKSTPEKVGGRALFVNDGDPVWSGDFVRAFEKLRPQKIQIESLNPFLLFSLCIIGDILTRLGVALPGELDMLTFSTYMVSKFSATVVNDAAMEEFGDWRLWTLEESVGRCVHFWERHQAILAKEQ
ncbi:hypothetical protein BJ742DRAFT_833275 [Cladochytrium replicatum]|nr:hypothetical protein BJ742DRAFT_833275 [Cladochytrium replicatum]